MKVVVAMDSFKGSLTSAEAGEAVRRGIQKAVDAEVIVKPMADGGEGTAWVLTGGLGGSMVETVVTGPLGDRIKASYGISADGRTAFIEMAQAAGLTLIKDRQTQPLKATTFGVGELIMDALDKGCRDFLICLGGSATSDGGVGMLNALGYEFQDKHGKAAGQGAQALSRIERISDKKTPPALRECSFRAACDVDNPLCGPEGAVYVFGPQKGVNRQQREPLDAAMRRYGKIVADFCGKDFSANKGAGAAGGMGFALMSMLGAELKPGALLVGEALGLPKCLENADLLVTGEGRMDSQSAMGKAPVSAARMAKKAGASVIALAGSLGEGAFQCNEHGIDACFSILSGPMPLLDAMKPEISARNLQETAEQIFRLIAALEKRQGFESIHNR